MSESLLLGDLLVEFSCLLLDAGLLLLDVVDHALLGVLGSGQQRDRRHELRERGAAVLGHRGDDGDLVEQRGRILGGHDRAQEAVLARFAQSMDAADALQLLEALQSRMDGTAGAPDA